MTAMWHEPGAPPTIERLQALIDDLMTKRMEERMARTRARAANAELADLDDECSELRAQIDRLIDTLSDSNTAGFVHP